MRDPDVALQREDIVSNDPEAVLAAIKFNQDGLVPAIAQQQGSGEVLMMAWMDRAAIIETLSSGRVCYFSRSRQALWRKGESSGQIQTLRRFLVDCDGDTILLQVEQTGVACHTGHHSCFFRESSPQGWQEIAPVLIAPESLYRHD